MAQLASFLDILDARSDSYLGWARSKDVEVYRQARDAGLLRERKRRPQAFEMDTSAQLLAGIYYLLQQDIHVASRTKKKFRGEPWPTPETAAEVIKREDAQRGYDDLMAEIVFIDGDYEQFAAEHAAEVTRIDNPNQL